MKSYAAWVSEMAGSLEDGSVIRESRITNANYQAVYEETIKRWDELYQHKPRTPTEGSFFLKLFILQILEVESNALAYDINSDAKIYNLLRDKLGELI